MNILIHALSLLGRYLYVLVAVGVLGGMPYCGQLVWNAYNEYHAAHERLIVAKKMRVEQELQMERIKEYKKFAEEVRAFTHSARENRLDEATWTTYEVNINQRLSTVTEMRNLLANVNATSRYYFKPKRMTITSLYAKDDLSPEMKKLVYGKEAPRPAAIPGVSPTGESGAIVPGEKVLFSLSGTYLVFPRS
ncbi:MAG: hypothetical protein HQM02_01925 [Magnetococcales bacterium]|nr:hypothetical protein [Magnetococcales bacterium]